MGDSGFYMNIADVARKAMRSGRGVIAGPDPVGHIERHIGLIALLEKCRDRRQRAVFGLIVFHHRPGFAGRQR